LRAYQLGCQGRQPIILTLCRAVFDRHILAFDETRFAQALTERGRKRGVSAKRCAVEKPDHWHGRLLRTRGERPAALPSVTMNSRRRM